MLLTARDSKMEAVEGSHWMLGQVPGGAHAEGRDQQSPADEADIRFISDSRENGVG